ncbi:MAG: OmpA family protein [Clostridia bacterium]
MRTLTMAALAAPLLFAGPAFGQAGSGNWTSSGVQVKNSVAHCWRAGYWTPAMANAECDPDLVPKAAPAAAPAPAPAPAPVAAPKPVFERATFAVDVLFEFDKADLRDEGKRQLDKLVQDIAKVNLDVFVAVGHADRIGTAKYNQRLSERRAASIKSYLVGKGIADNRIYTEGKGESQPVTGDKCRKMGPENGRNAKLVACLQPDRRVEIEVVGTRQK